MSILIRPATADDVTFIHQLVTELAIYERQPDAVVATPQDYLRYGFGAQRPFFESLIAEYHDQRVGFALYFYNYSTWTGRPSLYLEDLYVQPDYRGHGIGKKLFVELAKIAVKMGCQRYQWQVLDWNEPSIRFYESLGGNATKEWLPFRLEGDALQKLAHSP